jgi:hypothetical protein
MNGLNKEDKVKIERLIEILEVRTKNNPDDVVRSDWLISELKTLEVK